jgi:hypothetical protein
MHLRWLLNLHLYGRRDVGSYRANQWLTFDTLVETIRCRIDDGVNTSLTQVLRREELKKPIWKNRSADYDRLHPH